jgi:hypothetical protein
VGFRATDAFWIERARPSASSKKKLRVKTSLWLFCFAARMHRWLNIPTSRLKLLLKILAKGRINSVTEVPFKFATRRGGASKAGTMPAVHYLRLLWRLFFIEKPPVEHRT